MEKPKTRRGSVRPRSGLRAIASGLSALAVMASMLLWVGALAGQSASAATSPQTSAGTDFWLTFEQNYDGSSSLYLFISASSATTGTVDDPGISFSAPFSVTPGTVTQVSVPANAQDGDYGGVDPDAIHVTAGAPVSVYGLNTEQYTTDGFLGLPTDILGNSYIIQGYSGGYGLGSDFAVVGTQDNTTVTIDPTETVGTNTAGTPYTVTLDQGQVYQLADGGAGDLSGTTIASNNPVAVFAGNGCADVPPSQVACNTVTEEMTPTQAWGTDFLTEPLATRSGDTFRFMASQNGTTVNVNGSAVATLNAGQFYETILTTASEITANNPIQVMQYSNGSSYDGANSDPFDITIPPYEQFLNSYTVTTEPSGADPAITNNYINVVAPTSEVGTVMLDGSAIPASDFSPIGSSSFSGAQLSVDFGDHNLSGPLPFGVTVYGDGGYDGYGYPGGFTLSPIATVNKVTLTTTGGSGIVGSQACSTATAADQNSNPVSGVRVDFTVTGANPNSGFAYTDSNGQAQYCYTGQNVGADSIVAAVGSVQSSPATWTWSLAKTTLGTSLSGGGQSGATITVPAGTAVTDQATLSGANASSATGTVTYNVYSDPACTVSAGSPGTGSVSGGTVQASAGVTLTTPGTYYWTASYNGDGANGPSASTCGSETETVTQTSAKTTLGTSLSGGGQSGATITVPAGTAVTDQATLSGANASSATGTVTYNVYSDPACTVSAGSPGTGSVSGGTVQASAGVTLTTPGTYYWTASYNGDGANGSSASTCGSETETVTQTAPGTAPTVDGMASAKSDNSATAHLSTSTSGDLIVAYVAGDAPKSGGQKATVTGGSGLTWTRAARANAQLGDAEVWYARATGTLTNAAITATEAIPGWDETITVIAYKNATGIGNVKTFGAASGAPTGTLTTSQDNSLVYAVGDDWLKSKARTPGPGQTVVHSATDSVGDTYWVQATNAPTPTSGTMVTINDTAPTGDPFNLVLVEIK
jgi:IgGFc binding protein